LTVSPMGRAGTQVGSSDPLVLIGVANDHKFKLR